MRVCVRAHTHNLRREGAQRESERALRELMMRSVRATER